jgi:hypothetical protein
MNCLPLLRISVRLLDLHDAERESGNAPQFVQEDRRGQRDGEYLDIATLALDVLRQHAHDSGNAFMSFTELRAALQNARGVTSDLDIQYALAVLSRPTVLWLIDRSEGAPRLVSDKSTALVEKTIYADEYRLTSMGRTSAAVSAGIEGFAYAEGDALKLLRAVESGDFARVQEFCDALMDTIRYESMDLQLALEKGFLDRQVSLYKDQLPRYRRVITQTSELLRAADARLKAWRLDDAASGLDDTLTVDLGALQRRLLMVWQALEAFGRQLADLTKAAAAGRIAAVEPPDILGAALAMVRTPPGAAREAQLMRYFGPGRDGVAAPSISDVRGKVRQEAIRVPVQQVFETAGAAPELPGRHIRFLREHAKQLLARIKEGPLPLSEALSRGWCIVAGTDAVGELLGVYSAPWSLSGTQLLAVAVPPQMTEHHDTVFGRGAFSDLEISLIKEPPA